MPLDPLDRTRSVYALIDADGRWRYVGRSTSPTRRLTQHLGEARTIPRTPLHHWLRTLQSPPDLSVLELIAPGESGRDAEKRWIETALARGEPLLNRFYNPDWDGDCSGPRSAVDSRLP